MFNDIHDKPTEFDKERVRNKIYTAYLGMNKRRVVDYAHRLKNI